MSDLKLVSEDPTPMEKLLLDASRAEQPSLEHKTRLRALLGIGLPLSGPLPDAPDQALQLAPADAVAKSATLSKVAFGVGVVALFGAFALSRQNDGVQPPRTAVEAPLAAPVTPSLAEPRPPAPTVAPTVSALSTDKAPAAAATPPARAPAAGAADADLGEQIRLIEAARAGVAAHDTKAAAAALDAYAAKFPRGSFGQEAMVLRIRAIDQAGDSARASALAKSFVARFPSSPHVARLKAIAERGASR